MMKTFVAGERTSAITPAAGAERLVASDTAPVNRRCKALYIEEPGLLSVRCVDGSEVSFKVFAGQVLPLAISHFKAASTAAVIALLL